MIELVIHGVPVPQGSKVRTHWGMREDNPKTKPWRAAVAGEAGAAMVDREMLAGPVQIEAWFTFPRPKAHFRTGRFASELRDSAPHYHESRPDGDKLARAIGDALTGIVFRDDAQVARWTIWKVYGEPACARILVSEIVEARAEAAA